MGTDSSHILSWTSSGRSENRAKPSILRSDTIDAAMESASFGTLTDRGALAGVSSSRNCNIDQ